MVSNGDQLKLYEAFSRDLVISDHASEHFERSEHSMVGISLPWQQHDWFLWRLIGRRLTVSVVGSRPLFWGQHVSNQRECIACGGAHADTSPVVWQGMRVGAPLSVVIFLPGASSRFPAKRSGMTTDKEFPHEKQKKERKNPKLRGSVVSTRFRGSSLDLHPYQ
jgi:hypothetical protein